MENLKELLDALRNSFSYVDFCNTYNTLIEKGFINHNKEFLIERDKIKEKFYQEFTKEYPDKIIRTFIELRDIYEVPSKELQIICNEMFKTMEKLGKKIQLQEKFNKRFNQLQV
jgi:hypothetical protein